MVGLQLIRRADMFLPAMAKWHVNTKGTMESQISLLNIERAFWERSIDGDQWWWTNLNLQVVTP